MDWPTPEPHPIKAVLAHRRLTNREVAEAVGVNRNTLGRIINGYRWPWPALVERLSDYLDEDPSDLFRAGEPV